MDFKEVSKFFGGVTLMVQAFCEGFMQLGRTLKCSGKYVKSFLV